MSELALHIQVADYLRLALRPPVFWTSVDAGAGELSPKAAALCKARGIRAGVPDVLVFHPRQLVEFSKTRGFAGGGLVACSVVGIELKAERGRLSPVQVATHAEMALAGVRCSVARSLDDVERILTGEGVPLHARPYPLLQRQGGCRG